METVAQTSHPVPPQVLPGSWFHEALCLGRRWPQNGPPRGGLGASTEQNSGALGGFRPVQRGAWPNSSQGVGLGGLTALYGREKSEKPSTDRLSKLVAIVRCTRNSRVARYYRLRAIPRQALNPKPPGKHHGVSRLEPPKRSEQAGWTGFTFFFVPALLPLL